MEQSKGKKNKIPPTTPMEKSDAINQEDFQLIKGGVASSGGSQEDFVDCSARFKIIIVGDSAVGKSSIMLRATKNMFNQEHQLTIGVDFGGIAGRIGDDIIKMQVWDTAGTEQFRSVTRIFYRDANCVIFVYSIAKRASFDHIDRWINEVQANTDQHTLFVIVGNKVDLNQSQREVELEELRAYAARKGIDIVLETSAAIGTNIEKLFQTVGFTLYQRMLKQHEEMRRQASTMRKKNGNFELERDFVSSNKKKKGCC